MIPGPDYIYTCPNCGNLLTTGSLVSGNTFGAKIYSDGKRIAPMMPEFPDITKCRQCKTILWLSKLAEPDTYAWGDQKKPEWQNADRAGFLNIDDYFYAIEKGLADNKEEERYIRQRIWWSYNDRSRKGQKIFQSKKDELRWTENLHQLLCLLDMTDSNQKIMAAEIKRNLGEFEKCIQIIENMNNNDLNWLIEIFIRECEMKNRWVVELN